jgi:hypothetical protein
MEITLVCVYPEPLKFTVLILNKTVIQSVSQALQCVGVNKQFLCGNG